MQGRLLPKFQGRYQAHPKEYWQKEFEIAKKIGLDCIEFILDFNDAEENPLIKSGGVEEILEVCERTSVSTDTICADYFMEAPLHAIDKAVANKSKEVLLKLLESSFQLGVTDIVIPCVDQSSLRSEKEIDRFVNQIHQILPSAERNGINLSLETDLAPQPLVKLLDKFNSKKITVNYDIGNSAALGYDLIEELNAYGNKITDIHIKDRKLNGGPVVLGEGNANFKSFFENLKKFNYEGPFIFQAYRDDEGIEIFKKQLNWVKPYFNLLE